MRENRPAATIRDHLGADRLKGRVRPALPAGCTSRKRARDRLPADDKAPQEFIEPAPAGGSPAIAGDDPANARKERGRAKARQPYFPLHCSSHWKTYSTGAGRPAGQPQDSNPVKVETTNAALPSQENLASSPLISDRASRGRPGERQRYSCTAGMVQRIALAGPRRMPDPVDSRQNGPPSNDHALCERVDERKAAIWR